MTGFREACENNQLKIAKFIYKYELDGDKFHFDLEPEIPFKTLIEKPATDDLIFWLIETLSPSMYFYVPLASRCGKLELIKRICQPLTFQEKAYVCECEAIGEACVNGYFDIARWLKDFFQVKKYDITSKPKTSTDLLALCVRSDCDMGFRWVCENFKIGRDDYDIKNLTSIQCSPELKLVMNALLGDQVASRD